MRALTLLLFFVFAMIDWIAVANDWKAGEWVTKPAALAMLLLYAGLQPEVTWVLLAALTFSLLGDVYLMLPKDMFVAGLSAFLVGHVFYILSFNVDDGTRAIWLVVLLLASAPVGLKILGAAKPESMRPPVAIYMLVILTMVASAFASASFAAIAGAVLFYASDAMIAWNRFVDPFPGARVAIIVTYHLGQLGLVWGLT
jgi:uncharacterized membrane protein YhhN